MDGKGMGIKTMKGKQLSKVKWLLKTCKNEFKSLSCYIAHLEVVQKEIYMQTTTLGLAYKLHQDYGHSQLAAAAVDVSKSNKQDEGGFSFFQSHRGSAPTVLQL